MTVHEFNMLCNRHLVDPGVALENDELRAALAERDDYEVDRILREEF